MRRKFFSCSHEALEVRHLLSAAVETPTALVADEASAVQPLLSDVVPAAITYPGDVVVTPTHIITHSDKIPRFAAQPTAWTVRSGSWSDPAIWSGQRVPTTNDRVLIQPGTLVIYSSKSDVRVGAIEVGGRLIFATNVDTKLIVGTLTVMPTGTLQIGSESVPIAPQATAELVIADRRLNLTADPAQYGTGLLVFGKVSIVGSQLDQTWTRLAAEPKAGATSVLLPDVDDRWQPGDTLVLPDTRHVDWDDEKAFINGNLAGQWEEVAIDRVVGNRVYLRAPLQFDHLGARDATGALVLLPHVALLDRNVVVRSENPAGTRGHVMLLARADVDIEYARFQDLGRTNALRDLDNTTVDAQGRVTHIGTNQIGRYAVHLHHLIGPENPTNTGYQFEFVGNTVDGSLKWGVAIHGASYGLVDKNVVYDAQGAGIVTEDGSEVYNTISNNITIRMVGTRENAKADSSVGDFGRAGSGFWFRRGGNTIEGNVAADSSYAGFVIDSYFNTGELVFPLFRGAMPEHDGQGYTSLLSPPTLATNNEVYGLSTYGLWAAYTSGNNLLPNQPLTAFVDLRLWHIFSAGVLMYHTGNVTFAKLTIIGDWSAQDRDNTGSIGMRLSTYENRDLVIRDARIENLWIGIMAPRADASNLGHGRPTLIENARLKNYVNIYVSPTWSDSSGEGTTLVVRNVKFDMRTDVPYGPHNSAVTFPPANIYMALQDKQADVTEPSVVKVYSYNKVAGDDFQVFYKEQAPGAIVPRTDLEALTNNVNVRIGSPRSGLTNTQNWSQFGIAVAGAVAPANASKRAGIEGLVAPIVVATGLPKVVLVTPWNNAQISADEVIRIRHNVNGKLPSGYMAWFAVDDQPPFFKLPKGGAYPLPPGTHTLRAWIGDAAGRQLAGTVISQVTFRVNVSSFSSLAAPVGAIAGALTANTSSLLESDLAAGVVGATSVTPVLAQAPRIAATVSSRMSAEVVALAAGQAVAGSDLDSLPLESELINHLAIRVAAARLRARLAGA
ncbi:MAG: G8 domain-containing protein [Pirellulales bacterium]